MPNRRTIRAAWHTDTQGPIDATSTSWIMPEPRYFSMPSTDEGAEAFRKRARNCSPCVRSLVHSPEAVIHSPAEIVAAWPTVVTRSRWPRALIRSTQKPVSGLWKVTRSTRPASTSWLGAAPRPPAWPAGVRSRWSADGFGPGFMGVDYHRRLSGALLHESSLARTMPTDRILTCRCDTTLVGRGRSSD